MKRSAFEESNEPEWKELENSLMALEKKLPAPAAHRVPQLFRKVCGDLALAQHRMYGRRLCERLNGMVIGTYQFLQILVKQSASQFARFFTTDLPQAVRAENRLVWLSFALFFVPFGAFLLASKFDPSWIYATLPNSAQDSMDRMYGKSADLDLMEDYFGGRFKMFGFYILNNVSINFRIFAAGVLVGAGGMFMIGYQGIILGAGFAYVQLTGDPEKLYSFASSHSSWELLGFIIGGAGGMRLGMAIAKPGRLMRGAALREAGKRALPLLYGSMAMISCAAVIEGFFSPLPIYPPVKYVIGILGWVAFGAYYYLAGRRAHAA